VAEAPYVRHHPRRLDLRHESRHGTGKVVNLTQSGFSDRRAKWILGGKAMLWSSNRDGLRAAAQGGGGQADVYAMFFTQDAWDMSDGAYRSTYEEVMGKYATRKGIVVDTRFNGGGDLVADLVMFLSGKKFFEYTTDTRSSGYEPNFRWTKPSISLANEANYSDGHCYAYTVRPW